MNQVIGLTVDDVYYHVGVEFDSLQRAFELTEGPNNGTAITGRAIRDILGTTYSYTMTIHADPAHPLEYDALFHVLGQPVDYHKVSLVYGQTNIVFDAKIVSANDSFKGFFAGYNRWDAMSVNFIPMEPQRRMIMWDPSGEMSPYVYRGGPGYINAEGGVTLSTDLYHTDFVPLTDFTVVNGNYRIGYTQPKWSGPEVFAYYCGYSYDYTQEGYTMHRNPDAYSGYATDGSKTYISIPANLNVTCYRFTYLADTATYGNFYIYDANKEV